MKVAEATTEWVRVSFSARWVLSRFEKPERSSELTSDSASLDAGSGWPWIHRSATKRFFPCSLCAWLPAELFGRTQVSHCGQVRVNSSRATVGSCGSRNHSHGTEHPCTGPCMSWGRSALLLLRWFFFRGDHQRKPTCSGTSSINATTQGFAWEHATTIDTRNLTPVHRRYPRHSWHCRRPSERCLHPHLLLIVILLGIFLVIVLVCSCSCCCLF